jgi:hypothetical protein
VLCGDGDARHQRALFVLVEPAPVDAGLDDERVVSMVGDLFDVDGDADVVGCADQWLFGKTRARPSAVNAMLSAVRTTGATCGWANSLVLGEFRRRHPAIDLAVFEDHTDGLLAAVISGELDAALLGLGPYRQIPTSLNSLPVAHEPLVVAVHPEHPLAARSSVRLSALWSALGSAETGLVVE